jgi:hypothetical protein
MTASRIKIICDHCEHLIVTITRPEPGKVILSNDFEIEQPDLVRQAAGIVLAVCPRCQGKTEFPAKDLPQD